MVVTQESTSTMQPLPSTTSQTGMPTGGEASLVVLMVDEVVAIVVVVVVVVVEVLDVLVVVVDVLVVVVDVPVGGVALEGQSFHPSSDTDLSEYHVMTALGVTPSGPSVPVNTTPSTVNLS